MHVNEDSPKRGGHQDILNAILFVLQTGCQWNASNAMGIIPLDDAEFFCDKGCLERWLTGVGVEKLLRRIPQINWQLGL